MRHDSAFFIRLGVFQIWCVGWQLTYMPYSWGIASSCISQSRLFYTNKRRRCISIVESTPKMISIQFKINFYHSWFPEFIIHDTYNVSCQLLIKWMYKFHNFKSNTKETMVNIPISDSSDRRTEFGVPAASALDFLSRARSRTSWLSSRICIQDGTAYCT